METYLEQSHRRSEAAVRETPLRTTWKGYQVTQSQVLEPDAELEIEGPESIELLSGIALHAGDLHLKHELRSW